MNTIYHLSVKNNEAGGFFFFFTFFPKKRGELIRDDVFCVCGFTVIIFVICFSTDYVTAQDVFNMHMAVPCFSKCYDPDYESSVSSLISSVADSSLVSSSHLCHHDEDDDEDYKIDDFQDIKKHDGPQVNGAANIATSQELKSANEQLHSLQSG